MCLGDCLARIFEFLGKKATRVNLINDRGIHICKSLLAYQKYGNNALPNKKPDHFVGDWYVKYNEEEKKDPKLIEEAQEILRKWEQGDEQIMKLWSKMRKWALEGMKETYRKFGIQFDKEYYESETYKQGKEIIYKGLEDGLFEKDKTGAIFVDLRNKGLTKKVLLRADGTGLYITQDLYLVKKRYEDYHFKKMIYVVAREQEFHFKVLFNILKLLKLPFADSCVHYSYGMVNLPSGKMKSREGTVVDADDLLQEVESYAKEEILKREPDIKEEKLVPRARKIALSAIKFYLLKTDPIKDLTYDPKESISFDGETGPYIQYTYARIFSIIEKSGQNPESFSIEDMNLLKLNTALESKLIKKLFSFSEIIVSAGKQMKPSLIARYLLDLSKLFNEFYQVHPVLKAEEELRKMRLKLIACIMDVLKKGLNILGIDVLKKM